ncbi:hypothetical protein INS49_014167 [Diaporthe citri]|uniref:uncharacterized protein n=1 Tax=Diaporthe citri TaxID=83186 RepID=UPI001C7F0F7C|nr:uncharacterized protein INS49_014167 [Diaporthe citri]KAG6358283.1 hypothetical protein INS49_014167 [Diaporthe citri]
MSSNRDSEVTYQDDLEDATMAAGQSRASKEAMLNAGQSSRERRKNKKQAEEQK